MNQITLDAEWKVKLIGATKNVELDDESGQVLSRFMAEEHYVRLLYDIAFAEFALDDDHDEVVREVLEEGGISGEELLAALVAAKNAGLARAGIIASFGERKQKNTFRHGCSLRKNSATISMRFSER